MVEHNERKKAPICTKCNVRSYLTSFRYLKYRNCNRYQPGRNTMIYKCPKCGSYVTAGKQNKPLGIPADRHLRIWRIITHSVFNKLWQEFGYSPNNAYNWLAKRLKIKTKDCHIAMFDIRMCKKTITLSVKRMSELKSRRGDGSVELPKL